MLVIMRLAMMIAVLLSGAVTGQEVSQMQSLQTETVSDADSANESIGDDQETIQKFKIAPPKFHSEAVNYFGDTVRIWDSNQDGWEDFWCMIYREIKHREIHPDTDGDGVTDYHEMLLHRDPMVPGPLPRKLTPEEQKAQDVLNEKLRVENLAKQREQWKKDREALAPYLLIAETEKKYTEYLKEKGEKFLEEDQRNPVFAKPGHDTPQGLNQIIKANGTASISPSGHNLTGAGIDVAVVEGATMSDHTDLPHFPFLTHATTGVAIVNSTHTTAVAGVIASTGGLNAQGRGVAPGITLRSFQINPATSVFARLNHVENISFISNHSYGPTYGWTGFYDNIGGQGLYPLWEGNIAVTKDEPNHAGQYRDEARIMDAVAHQNPEHTFVTVAGNSRVTSYPFFPRPPDPEQTTNKFYSRDNAGNWVLQTFAAGVSVPRSAGENNSGFDSLSLYSASKNAICVGAVNSDYTPWFNSGFGPTDGGMTKPDLVANGSFVVAPYVNDSGQSVYSSNWHGTSFAAPVVTGAAALIREQVEKSAGMIGAGSFTADALKCILIHTAMDINNTGPDYRTGWGNVNIDYAVELVKSNYSLDYYPFVKSFTLQPGQISRIEVVVENNVAPFLKATLVWSDPPANVLPGLNNSYDIANSMLVNDLDLYVEDHSELPHRIERPWVLNPWQPHLPALRGINTLDNVEQVFMDDANGNGVYTIIVDATKLTGGPQDVALAFTGNIAGYEETKVLKIVDLRKVGDDEWSLGWRAHAGQKYTIQKSTGLGMWEDVATGVEAIGDIAYHVVPSEGDKTFWRVVEE